MSLLVRFAAGLASSTNGRLYADIQPLPRSSTKERRFQFALRVTRQPTTKVVLFLLQEVEATIVVEGWSEEVTLKHGGDVAAFVSTVTKAAETSAAIEQLLLVAVELERNEAG